MVSTRITLARVLELGVCVTWREATAVVHEAMAATRATGGAGPARVTAESCVLTRGGDVVLTGTAAQAPPEVVVRLLDDLLASCSTPGRFAGAVADGTAIEMIEELNQHITAKRRRVEVAAVALRGLAAEADAARAISDGHERDPSADSDDVIAAPTPASSLPAVARPSVTAPAPLSASAFGNAAVRKPRLDHKALIAAVQAARVWTAEYVRRGSPSRFEWLKRASLAAIVCSVLAVAASGILVLQTPATRRSAVELSEPVIEPMEIDAPVALNILAPLGRPDPALLPEEADPPSAPPLVAASAPRGSRTTDRTAPVSGAPASVVRSVPLPARGPKTPAENTARVAGSGSLSTTSAAASKLAPDAPNLSAGAPSPAVDLSSDVARPSEVASSPAENLDSGSRDAPASVVAGSARRDAETRAIENVLGRYRIALNTLDAGAASAVWPTVNEKTLAKAFERLESHEVSFDRCQIEIYSVLAEAACSGSARYVPAVGSRTPKDEARRWRFTLLKASGGWQIDSVEAR